MTEIQQPLFNSAKCHSVTSVTLSCCNLINATQGDSLNSRKKQTNKLIMQKKFQENAPLYVWWQQCPSKIYKGIN